MNQQVCQNPTRDATTMPEPRRSARETGAVHKTVRRLLGIGLIAGVAYALWRKLPTAPETGTHWEPQPFPFPPQPAREVDVDDSPWVEAADAGACPAHHPVKAKLTSGIFHVPGGRSYARTKPERCYATPDDAEADGFRRAKL